MSQESALSSLPSFSKTAFSKTTPQIKYKQVRRIGDRPPPRQDDDPTEECRSTLMVQRTFPDAKEILLINGVDRDCKSKIEFNSTNIPLPFLYGAAATTTTAPTKPQQPEPTTEAEPSRDERKRPKRDSEPRVEVEGKAQPERKRPKREAERRAEALARQGKW